MYTFPIPKLSLYETVFLAVVAVFLIISLLRLVLRRLFTVDLALGRRQNLEPRVSTSPQGEASGSGAAGPTAPYLASCVDDDDLIGGSHIHLSPPRGPKGINLTFRVFTPPSFDKEIPKIDLYGVINFVRTGKVRHFVPRGSLRLLVINLREMTLAVYAPKQVKKKKQNKSNGKLFAADESISVRSMKKNNRRGGISISTSATKLMDDVEEDDADNVEVSEDAWKRRHFESKPAMLHRLDDLVSVAALPPRHGGVIEIMSRLGTLPRQKMKGEDLIQNAKPTGQKRNGRRPLSPRKQQSLADTSQNKAEKWQPGFDENNCRLEYVEISSSLSSTGVESEVGTTARSKDKNGNNDVTVQEHRDEYAFCTPRDAAEFQRIIMVLRTVGREISYLYETLEAIQSASDTSMFAPPGVVLEDVWHCLKEMPSVRKCLHQYQLLSRFNDEHDGIFSSNSNEILEGNNFDEHKMLPKKDWAQCHHEQRTLLGLVDFFSLFFPPLSIKDSHAIPCFTPCAKSESIMTERDTDLMLTSGIEWHYHRLCFVSALQRRVSRAALYVRVYAWARVISHDGWWLDDDGRERDYPTSHDAGAITNVGENAETVDLEPGTISNSSFWSPPLINSDHQGYSCVGWYAFRSPPLNKKPSNITGKTKVLLAPDADPLHCIPSLRKVVEKYPYASFFVFSYFSEQIGIAVYFLLVRSLPVGGDRDFDNTMSSFYGSCAKERDESLRISLELVPGEGSSLATRVTFGAVLTALRHEISRAAIKFHPGKQMISLSELQSRNLASLWHYGGSLQKRDDLPMNYAAVNSQFRLNKIPKWIIGRFIVDFTCVLKAVSNSLVPERAITSIRMANIDLKYVASDSGVKDEEGRIHAENAVNVRSNVDDGCNPEVTASATHNTALNCRNECHESYGNSIDTICELLDGMTVPLRKRGQVRGEHSQDNQGEIITTERAPFQLKRTDIERYFNSCECDLKSTVVRIVESAAWRGIMFPVDERSCRVEMQSAQFFQQGYDKESNPIFYFRNQLRAPWRNDIHASALSMLHRLETYFLKVERQRPNVKITVIAILGCPSCPIENECRQTKVKKNGKNRDSSEDEQPTSTPNIPPPSAGYESLGSDPRIDPYEVYHSHSNSILIQLLNELIPRHYPGRLAKVLVVPSKGKTRLRTLIPSQFQSQFQSRVTVLSSGDELMKYVKKDQLVMFAGGNAKVTSGAFDCGNSYNHIGN